MDHSGLAATVVADVETQQAFRYPDAWSFLVMIALFFPLVFIVWGSDKSLAATVVWACAEAVFLIAYLYRRSYSISVLGELVVIRSCFGARQFSLTDVDLVQVRIGFKGLPVCSLKSKDKVLLNMGGALRGFSNAVSLMQTSVQSHGGVSRVRDKRGNWS
jgi:hypothetical protein